MNGWWLGRGWRVLALRTLGGSVALILVLLVVLALTEDLLKGPIVRYVAAQSQRQIQVAGAFHAHLFSLHPRIVADEVTVGNPPWMPAGITAQVGHLELTYDLLGALQLEAVVAERATLNLNRGDNGHSNWQTQPPGSGPGTGPPLIHSLRMRNARVHYDDVRRRLKFDGIITAQDYPRGGATPPLRIEGTGQLNGHPTQFALNCDPLATVSTDRPYRFNYMEVSTGTLLTGTGSVPHPFDFRYLQLAFQSTGEDMKDLYFLTGLSLPETGGYHLTGTFDRQDHRLVFADLAATTGQSDMHGSMLVETQRGGAPSHTKADLRSKLLRVADLGAQAAGRAKPPVDKGLILPDTPLQLDGARHTLADVDFHAQTLQIGSVPLRDVATRVQINLGTIAVAPLNATLRDGKLSGGFKLDVSEDIARADVDMQVAHLKLALGPQPPVEGPVHARVALRGRGNSIHELAANAAGTVTAVLPHGAMRSSLAELAGFDLQGIGLMAAGNKTDTGIRCGVASFDVKGGTLTAQRLLVDTDPMLITGAGTISLDSEAFDLQLTGHPKHPRLRLRSPVLVRGTLKHPAFSLEGKKPLAQAGGAIALGVLLTPVAAILAFVDPGLAKDSDCGALLAQVRKEEK